MDKVPNTAEEIQAKIERAAATKFVMLNVPELFWYEMGLEYIGGTK